MHKTLIVNTIILTNFVKKSLFENFLTIFVIALLLVVCLEYIFFWTIYIVAITNIETLISKI